MHPRSNSIQCLLTLLTLLGLDPTIGMPLAYSKIPEVFGIHDHMITSNELTLTTNGVNNNPDDSLERVGGDFPDGPAFTYPDTTNPVRLYLIDTAIGEPTSWTIANPKLTFEGTILVRGSGDPTVSTPRTHGTQLLSLVTGLDAGITPGTPIHLLNYDIYPQETTTVTLLSSAILKAVQHSKASGTVKMRSAILISTSSLSTGSSATLEDLVDFAIAEGIPVIVSAGNLNGQNAANHLPCAYGIKAGVICVGSAGANDEILASSSTGTPLDLLAPGEDVRTRSVSATSPFVNMTGTSPAAALVAGAVLAELSIQGSLTPAQVESRILASAVPNTAGMPVLRTTTAAIYAINNPDGPVIPSHTPALLGTDNASLQTRGAAVTMASNVDSDGDGIADIIESFHGAATDFPPASSVSISAPGTVRFKFPVSSELFRSSTPFVLSSGTTWKVSYSTDCKVWNIPVGSLSKLTDPQGQIWLIADFPSDSPSCYARLLIHP